MATRNRRKEETGICSNAVLFLMALFALLIGLVLVIVGSVKLHYAKSKCSHFPSLGQTSASSETIGEEIRECDFSAEALRVNLSLLLGEVKEAYFAHNPDNVAWNPDLEGIELTEYVKTRYEVNEFSVIYTNL